MTALNKVRPCTAHKNASTSTPWGSPGWSSSIQSNPIAQCDELRLICRCLVRIFSMACCLSYVTLVLVFITCVSTPLQHTSMETIVWYYQHILQDLYDDTCNSLVAGWQYAYDRCSVKVPITTFGAVTACHVSCYLLPNWFQLPRSFA